jgi:hypothetical protein
MDAIRISDGQAVGLKKVSKSRHPYEAEIGQFFSSDPLAKDPRNHCIPMLEILSVPDDDDLIIIVLPLLREYYNPRFDTCGEVMECIRQFLEVRSHEVFQSVASQNPTRGCNSCTTTMLHIGALKPNVLFSFSHLFCVSEIAIDATL